MPILKYISDKRRPDEILTTDLKKYTQLKSKKVSYQIEIPSNIDANVTLNRFIYGPKDISLKFKLVRFYLNQNTFKYYQNIDLMSNIISSKFGINNFICHTIHLASVTPELFTVNKSHYIMSYLLNLAFQLLTEPNTKESYHSYSSLLGYLQRDILSKQLYGVSKNILMIKPLETKECMSYKLKGMVQHINQHIKNTESFDVYPKLDNNVDITKIKPFYDAILTSDNEDTQDDYYSSDEESIPINSQIIEINDSDEESEDEICQIMPLPIKKDDESEESDVEFIETPDIPDNSNEDNIPDLDTLSNNDSIDEPLDVSMPPLIPYLNDYVDNNEPLNYKDLFTCELTPEQKQNIEPLLQIIPLLRKEAKMLIPKNRDIMKPMGALHLSLPKVFQNLFHEYPYNLVIAGGHVVNTMKKIKCLTGDIDIFILNMSDDAHKCLMDDIKEAIDVFSTTYKVRCVKYGSVLTICSDYHHTIQFIKTNYKSVKEVINKFDIKCCQSAYTIHGGEFNSSLKMGLLRPDSRNNNSKLPLRVIKYLMKGFRLESYEAHTTLLDDVVLLCQQYPDAVSKQMVKYYNPAWVEDEEELKKQMSNIYGKFSTYLGNDLGNLDLKAFKSFQDCYHEDQIKLPVYSQFYRNLLTENIINTMSMKAIPMYGKYASSRVRIYVPSIKYYFPLNTNYFHMSPGHLLNGGGSIYFRLTDLNTVKKIISLEKIINKTILDKIQKEGQIGTFGNYIKYNNQKLSFTSYLDVSPKPRDLNKSCATPTELNKFYDYIIDNFKESKVHMYVNYHSQLQLIKNNKIVPYNHQDIDYRDDLLTRIKVKHTYVMNNSKEWIIKTKYCLDTNFLFAKKQEVGLVVEDIESEDDTEQTFENDTCKINYKYDDHTCTA